MCLPVSWEGGSDESLDKVIVILNTKGTDGARIASFIESNRSYILFWAFDTTIANVATNVNIGNDSASMTVSQFMDLECQQLPAYYQQNFGATADCFGKSEAAIGNLNDVGRVEIEEVISGSNMKAIQYIIPQGNYFWEVTFTTDSSKYSDSLSTFDTAISTLNITQQ
jgi:hypothetical protein